MSRENGREWGIRMTGNTGEMYYIRRNSPDFPGRFEGISGSPKGLYVIGELPRDDLPTVGIVGARMCSRYGHETAYEFGRVLAGKGVQIVSGLALGIDCYAQEGALAGGGKTFAVLGCGADICYPKSNREVYEKIKTSGGILSEEKPGTPPLAYNFPKRNRIISALSDIVLVVEAKEKSGSLITVDFALEQGKTVYAVPGRISDLLSYGCNCLIAQGAGIACSPEVILMELESQKTLSEAARRSRKRRNEEIRRELDEKMTSARITAEAYGKTADLTGLSAEALAVYDLLDSDPVPLDVLYRRSGRQPGALASALYELQTRGLAVECGRNHYARA